MREGWKIKKLGDVSNVQRGLTYGKNDTADYSENVVLRATNIKLESSSLDFDELKYLRDDFDIKDIYKLKVGSLLICFSSGSKNHLGKVAMVDKPYSAAFGGFIGQITPNEIINPRYLFYNLVSDNYRKYISDLTDGMNINNLKSGDLKQFPIPIPPLGEQKQIVAILDKAFGAIDQAKANIEKNIENAKELFENWTFKKIKNSNWDTINWGETCDFIRGPFGGSLKKSMFVESGYAVYEQKQAIHNDYDSLRYFINEEKFNEMKRFEVKPSDLLMSCSGVTLGRISEVPKDAPQGIINQALLKLRAKPNKILNDFLIIWIRSKIFQDLIFKFAGGAAQPNVPGVKILKAIKVPCPPINEQLEFINLHNNINKFTDNSINANLRKIESLEELKKSILQKAFAGELTKKEIVLETQ